MVSCVHVYIHIYTHTLSFTCIYFSTVIGSVSYPQFYTLIFFFNSTKYLGDDFLSVHRVHQVCVISHYL